MQTENNLRNVLLVTKYTRLERHVDERSLPELCLLDDFKEAQRQPGRWDRDFTLSLLLQRGITDIKDIPEYHIRKFHEHYKGLAHVQNALEEHSDVVGNVHTLPFKTLLRMYASSEDMVRRAMLRDFSHVFIAAGDKTFKTMALDLPDSLCMGIKTAESSEGFFSSCTGEEFGECLDDLVNGRYTLDPYHTVDLTYYVSSKTGSNGFLVPTRTLAEISLQHSEEHWNTPVTFAITDGGYHAEHRVTTGLVVAPLLGVKGWIESEVHDLKEFREAYQVALSHSRETGVPMLCWTVQAPKDRRKRQYGFTERVEVEALSRSTVCIGDKERFPVNRGDRLIFTPAEEPFPIVRFR